jgi:hypothetical protein
MFALIEAQAPAKISPVLKVRDASKNDIIILEEVTAHLACGKALTVSNSVTNIVDRAVGGVERQPHNKYLGMAEILDHPD